MRLTKPARFIAKANELLDRAKSDPEGAKNEAVSILNALGVSVSDAKVTVNGNDITISANINGTYVPYSFSNADTHPEIGEAEVLSEGPDEY